MGTLCHLLNRIHAIIVLHMKYTETYTNMFVCVCRICVWMHEVLHFWPSWCLKQADCINGKPNYVVNFNFYFKLSSSLEMSNTQETPHSYRTSPRCCRSQQPPDHALLQLWSSALPVLVPAGGDATLQWGGTGAHLCRHAGAQQRTECSYLYCSLPHRFFTQSEPLKRSFPSKKSLFQSQFHNQTGEKIISCFTAKVRACHCHRQQIHPRQRWGLVLGKLLARRVVTKR